jgi:putative ABC transport system permease protein
MVLLFLRHMWRYSVRRPALTLLNLVGMALGITVFVSVQIINHSALQSFRASVDIVSGKAHMEIVGNGSPLDESIYARLQSQSGLAASTPYVEEVAMLADHPGEYLQILGLDPFSSRPFRTFTWPATEEAEGLLDFLGDPTALALTRSFADRLKLKPGDALRLRTTEGIKTFHVRFVFDFNEDVVGANEHIAVMDIANAQESFAHLGQLHRINLQLAPEATWEKVSQELGAWLPAHAVVQRPDRRGQQVDRMMGAFQLNLSALSLISLLVGMFLIYNTVSAAVVKRRAEIGILRSLGLTGNQVRLLFLGEALFLGFFGLLLGLAGGIGLAQLLIGQVSETVTSLYLLVSIREIFFAPWSIAATIFLGLGSVFIAAWFPATEAARITPIEAMQVGSLAEKSTQQSSHWLAMAGLSFLLALGLAAWSLAWGPAWLSFGCALFTLLGFAFVVPRVVKWIADYWQPRRISTQLAVRHFGRSQQRNAMTIAALVTAIAMLVGLSIMIYSFRSTVSQWLNESVRADLFIADTANLQVGARKLISPALEKIVAQHPLVAAYDTYREVRLSRDNQPYKLAAIRFDIAAERNPLRFVSGQGVEIFPEAAGRDMVAVSETFARKFRVKEGDRLEIATPGGLIPFHVRGIFYDYTTEMGLVLMDRTTFQRHWQDTGYHSLALYLQPGAEAALVQRDLKEALAAQGSYLVYSNQQLRGEVFRIFDQTFRVTYVLQTVALLVSGLGIFLNLMVMTAERRREIGILRALGTRPDQLMSIILQEAALIGGVGAGLGLMAGFALAAVLSYVINIAFFGWTIQWATPWVFLLTLPFSIIFTAVAAGYFPARQAAQQSIAEAVKME